MAVKARTAAAPSTGSPYDRAPRSAMRERVSRALVFPPPLATERPSLAPRLLVFSLLVAGAALDAAPGHGPTHWLVLAMYGAGSLTLAQARSDHHGKLAWGAVCHDALLAVYVLVENAGVRADGLSRVPDMLGQLPALLLLLQTGLTLSFKRTLVYAGIVALSWLAIVIMAASSAWPQLVVQQKLFGLVAFLAACFFVVHGVRRLRLALASATRSELERLSLARFVPNGAGVDLVDRGRSSGIKARSACMLAVDIRGFSELTRSHGAERVVDWLLEFRAVVHSEVTNAGGIVDKYVGDGVLALFLDGSPERQAEAALASAIAIRCAMKDRNGRSGSSAAPALRLTIALHAGEVLAGVFDDGLRAEFSVLGPAMNALSRIERRAKDEGEDLLASKRFARLLEPALPHGLSARRLDRRPDDDNCPDLVSLLASRPGQQPRGVTYPLVEIAPA